MAISINEITSGIGLLIDSNIYIVTEYSHVKPGKGSAFVRVKIKNVKTGAALERTFRSSETLEDIPLEERRLQYQYNSGDMFHFMDLETFEQIDLPRSLVEDSVGFLQENLEVMGLSYHHQFLKITLPNFIIFEIKETEPGFKGDSTKSSGKPATLDTGAIVQVPLFINVGDLIKIDTRTGDYIERVKR